MHFLTLKCYMKALRPICSRSFSQLVSSRSSFKCRFYGAPRYRYRSGSYQSPGHAKRWKPIAYTLLISSEAIKWWNNLAPGNQIFAQVLAINCLIFVSWRIRRINGIMMEYFCSNPATRIVFWPMLMSSYTHFSFIHLLANMYVLNSFAERAVNSLGKEQFIYFYLNAGFFATMTSYYYKIFRHALRPSLGASGAIMAIVAWQCLENPNSEMSLLFLPNYTIAAGTIIKFIIGMDICGCLLRWKIIDHAAHLGGALFGIFWWRFGQEHLWGRRKELLQCFR